MRPAPGWHGKKARSMTTALAALGLGLSVVLAGIKVWETFMLRPNLTALLEWVVVDQVPVLRVAFANVGRKKGTIMDLRFREASMPSGRGWTPYRDVLERLPVVLDTGAGFAFHVELPPASTAERPRDAGVEWLFEDAVRTGRVTTLEVDVGGAPMVEFEVPVLPIVREQWRSNIVLLRGTGPRPAL
jgi:hypothetical protein